MQILINENDEVTSIIRTGYIDGAIEVSDNIPDDFEPIKYKFENGIFVLNPDYVHTLPDTLTPMKESKIIESKTKLAEWLKNNPMQFTDGKYYSCTEEKQALLNGNLASYERATSAGIEYPLKWNSTGEECTDWLYNDLVTLSLSIAGYVAPKVSMQQAYELQIKACETVEEVNEIVINYD